MARGAAHLQRWLQGLRRNRPPQVFATLVLMAVRHDDWAAACIVLEFLQVRRHAWWHSCDRRVVHAMRVCWAAGHAPCLACVPRPPSMMLTRTAPLIFRCSGSSSTQPLGEPRTAGRSAPRAPQLPLPGRGLNTQPPTPPPPNLQLGHPQGHLGFQGHILGPLSPPGPAKRLFHLRGRLLCAGGCAASGRAPRRHAKLRIQSATRGAARTTPATCRPPPPHRRPGGVQPRADCLGGGGAAEGRVHLHRLAEVVGVIPGS